MPWNEPNQEGSADYGTPNAVAGYSHALRQALNDSGVNGKVFLLSPMINQSHSNFNKYVSSLGGASFFNIFDGISMNLYDFGEETCGQPLCNPDPHLNPARYEDILGIMGVSGKPVFGVESGTAGNNFYWRQPPSSSSPLYRFVQNFFPVAPEMFAIPSYDLAGEVGHSWSLFNPPDTTDLLASQPDGRTTSANFDQDAFEAWLNRLTSSGELVSCGNCGYAYKDNRGLCSGSAFTSPGEEAGVPAARSGTDSRPFACENCNTTDKLIGSCATSFTVNDQISYKKKEGDYCELQNQGWWVEKDWGGTIGIDPSSTTIPFVGKKGAESEQKYLADYFEGTDKYYYFYQDAIQKMNHAGVWRKLAPKQTQDKLKREMVSRSCTKEEGGTHDYQVISENGETALLSEINNHKPPSETETNYEEKYDAWENSDGGKWARLWAAVPMFSHEDTPGQIVPYVATKIHDTVTYPLPAQEVQKVPHVARLYEASKAVGEILKPKKEETAQSSGNSSVLLAAAEKYQPEEKVLLAEDECRNHLVASIVNPSVSGGSLHYALQICPACSGYGCIGDVRMGPCGNLSQVHSVCGCFTSDNPAIAPPIPISCPGTATICENAQANRDVAPEYASQVVSANCQVTVDSNCNITSSSCGAAPPPPPSCGLPGASPVDACNKEAIRDINPNDTLCCSMMKINLSAVDEVINTDYTPCITIRDCGGEWIDGTFYRCNRCGLNPNGEEVCVEQPSSKCEDVVQVAVNRQVGITLSHPYLSEIWEYTGKDKTGVFNIFRPETSDKFEELAAASDIQYSYSRGSVNPATGNFYFPYLGGIQKAKNWVIRTLYPYGAISTAEPRPSSGETPASDELGYNIRVNDTSQTVDDATRTSVIKAVKESWPKTKIEENWDYVVKRARESGFNPVLVLAIWIEESGASGVNAYDLGIPACNPNDLEDQLNCFSKIPYKDASFEEFMCMFAEGEHHICTFDNNPDFPGNLKYWYHELTR